MAKRRHVGVVEQGDALGRQFDDALHSLAERLDRLVRQSVHQVDVHTRHSVFARLRNGRGRLIERLVAIDGFLDLRVEVLDAHRHAVESELGRGGNVLGRRHPRVDLDADLGVGKDPESRGRMAVKIAHLLGRQVGRRAAAPMELNGRPRRIDVVGEAVDLGLQPVEVRVRDFLVLVDDDVAAAEPAELLAEGNVEVERHRPAVLGVRARERAAQVVDPEGVSPFRSGGIARVAWPVNVVSVEHFDRQGNGLALDTDVDGVGFGAHAAFPAAARTVAMKASAFSTGVVGRIPWPRLAT